MDSGVRMTDLRVSARTANGVLFFVLMVVAGLSVFHAIIKPFWFDEICTLIVAQLRSMTDVWDALKAAADGNPPVYYAIVRLAHAVIPDEHLALRLPSILGVMIVIACLYISLSSRIDRLSVLVGSTFVLCTRIGSYAYEGRPYALMLACVSVAILAWLRMERSRGYAVLLGIALALSVSMHYWAVLVWPAFVIAEATVVVVYRRLRVGVGGRETDHPNRTPDRARNLLHNRNPPRTPSRIHDGDIHSARRYAAPSRHRVRR